MFAWTDSSVVSLQTRITSVFCDASGDKAPTRYYTADQSEMEKGAYDVTISENDVWSPSTADAITAAAVIAVLISGVAAVSKKPAKRKLRHQVTEKAAGQIAGQAFFAITSRQAALLLPSAGLRALSRSWSAGRSVCR